MVIYGMSDIHGEIEILKESFDTLIKNNLENNKENKLILLGDYLYRKNRDTKILYYLKDLQEQFNNQIIVLMGNHEFMFLEDIQTGTICFYDKNIIDWLKSLPFYYETDTQIFVHAGIDEEAGEYWKWGAENYYFCSKYPHTIGKFYKDIIAGHIFTSEITRDENYHKVFWDRKSHFYIDGETEKSKFIPVLKYDTITKRYSSFEKILKENNTFLLSEYIIK